MAKYRVTSGFSLGGHVDVYPGDVVELDDKLARHYLARQRVAPIEDVTTETVDEPKAGKGKKG